jgi:hypothetical protein
MLNRSIVVACALVAAAPGAEAAARVFVSVNGNDANTCSNIATPCRTLNAGITQVDPAGEVIVIDTGSFAGATIAKSVKINVPSGVVAFSASPITVAAGVSDIVVLRGLTIKAATPGTGVGVSFSAGAALYIEGCVIDGWDVGVSIGAAGKVFVADTIVRNSASFGIASGTARVAISGRASRATVSPASVAACSSATTASARSATAWPRGTPPVSARGAPTAPPS